MTTAQRTGKRKGRQQSTPTVARNIRIATDTWKAIVAIAEDEMTEPAAIVRKALRQWLSSREAAA
jgi:hypothetical protein